MINLTEEELYNLLVQAYGLGKEEGRRSAIGISKFNPQYRNEQACGPESTGYQIPKPNVIVTI